MKFSLSSSREQKVMGSRRQSRPRKKERETDDRPGSGADFDALSMGYSENWVE